MQNTITPKLKLLIEAQAETNLFVAHKRLDLAKALKDLDAIQADDDYKLTIITLLEAFGTAQSLTFISRILPDGDALAAARKSLREPNEEENRPALIEEFKDPKDKTRLMIKLIAKAAPVAEQQSPAAPAAIAEQQSPAVSPPTAESAPAKTEEVVTAPEVAAPATAA